ncbi:hypothetical protein [Halospeciosus flavus]|uniref:Uncharacterized protein n=1 Tax=Halospeciosus flavus TaxID=3032283 RepID=A0ABD5Z048_9EURY
MPTNDSNRIVSRRNALKTSAGLFAATIAAPTVEATSEENWTDLKAKYEVKSTSTLPTGEHSARTQIVETNVVDKNKNILTIESSVTENGKLEKSTYTVPVNALLAEKPKKYQKGDKKLRERINVEDGWVDEFDGLISTDEIEFSLEFSLLERSGSSKVGGKGKPIVVLP